MHYMYEEVKVLMFLVDEYGLQFSKQSFEWEKSSRDWICKTYSFYNESGCFTICYDFKGDMLIYYASEFSCDRRILCEKLVNIWSVEPEIWKKHKKVFGLFADPFFEEKTAKVLRALAEVIRKQIEETNEFFGVKIR